MKNENGSRPIKTTCFMCGEEKGEVALAIIKNDKVVNLIDGKTVKTCIDMVPCNECRGKMGRGIMLVGIKGSDKKFYPDRSGDVFVVTEDEYKKLPLLDKIDIDGGLKSRNMFIDHRNLKKMGFRTTKKQKDILQNMKQNMTRCVQAKEPRETSKLMLETRSLKQELIKSSVTKEYAVELIANMLKSKRSKKNNPSQDSIASSIMNGWAWEVMKHAGNKIIHCPYCNKPDTDIQLKKSEPGHDASNRFFIHVMNCKGKKTWE